MKQKTFRYCVRYTPPVHYTDNKDTISHFKDFLINLDITNFQIRRITKYHWTAFECFLIRFRKKDDMRLFLLAYGGDKFEIGWKRTYGENKSSKAILTVTNDL